MQLLPSRQTPPLSMVMQSRTTLLLGKGRMWTMTVKGMPVCRRETAKQMQMQHLLALGLMQRHEPCS